MLRQPAVAGQFYPYDSRMLEQQVAEFIDLSQERIDARGIVSPHAGFTYSGPAAGAVYSRIKTPDTYIILGPNHHGMGPDFSIMTEGVWNMPFGEVRVDSTLAKELFKNSGVLYEDELAHSREHSIEVQLPFMQYAGRDFQIIPISVKHYLPDENYLDVCIQVAESISKVLSRVDTRVTVVASTDFTHYEPHDVAVEKDAAALDAILSLDSRLLFEEIRGRRITMCGYGPVAVTIEVCRMLGSTGGELVKYMTSGETSGDYSQVVGYGSVIIP
ncbi:MAG: AmmeMemoRadiSam system protein B [Candidatus Altiarchaeota archaeon]